jgi:hypothetical protein
LVSTYLRSDFSSLQFVLIGNKIMDSGCTRYARAFAVIKIILLLFPPSSPKFYHQLSVKLSSVYYQTMLCPVCSISWDQHYWASSCYVCLVWTCPFSISVVSFIVSLCRTVKMCSLVLFFHTFWLHRSTQLAAEVKSLPLLDLLAVLLICIQHSD